MELTEATAPSQFTLYVGVQFTNLTLDYIALPDKNNPVRSNTTWDPSKVSTLTLWEYETDYDFPPVRVDHSNEHYQHHRFGDDWEVTLLPTCEEEGVETRYCLDCNPTKDKTQVDGTSTRPIDALGHEWNSTILTKKADGDAVAQTHWIHYVNCTRPLYKLNEKTGAIDLIGYCGYNSMDAAKNPKDPKEAKLKTNGSLKSTDPEYYTQINNTVVGTLIVDHDWDDWKCYVKPVEGKTEGHWTRTCKISGCGETQDFTGTQAEYDAMINPPTPPHPVLKAGLVPEIKDGVVVYKLYSMGIFQDDFTGIADTVCEGAEGEYYVVDGIWQNKDMGATLVDGVWYFLANGTVQEVTQLAEYDGEWFYVEDGIIDTEMNGLVDYDGGTFMLGAGRIQKEVSGLWENSKSIGGDGNWYYLANGQVQKDYTGLVQYDGAWFYVENGQLVPFNGEVEYDGEVFTVKEGMVVA
jgi:hypothetical protein